jgi:hypothetical protein
MFGDYYYPPHLFGEYYCTILGIIITPLICLGIITVHHFRDYYYRPILGIIPPPREDCLYTFSDKYRRVVWPALKLK